MTLPAAVALVERVRAVAERRASEALEALATIVSAPVTFAIRECPNLPPTIEERIIDHRAQTTADSVMYRHALADAANRRGWQVRWYDRDLVFSQAAERLGRDDIADLLGAMGRSVGPPWQATHKLAAAAALAVSGEQSARVKRRRQ